MKLKLIMLLVAVSVVLLGVSCTTAGGLSQGSSIPGTTKAKPAAVVEVIPPAPAVQPAPAPKAVAKPKPVPPPVVEPKPAPEKTFQVGSKGPAGGFVVYDKGSKTEGWRYLELAPAETEFAYLEWGGSGTLVGDLQKGIGSGLENTRRIVSVFGPKEPKRGNNYPAKMCDDLVYNGHSDWFLPSIEELKLVYTNLVAKDLGDIADPNMHSFWSSNEQAASSAWYLTAANGSTSDANRDFKNKTRAMRRF